MRKTGNRILKSLLDRLSIFACVYGFCLPLYYV